MSGISLTLQNIEQLDSYQWDRFCQARLRELVNLTPVASGACAAAWELQTDDEFGYFENPMHYASYLEHGWSSQAPDGMIQVLMQEYADWVYDYDLGDART